MTDEKIAVQRKLAAAGAILFGIGMVTGLWLAAAATGQFSDTTKQLAHGAHLNGLLGGLWIIAVAWTFEFLHYQARGLRRLALGVAVPAWANWLVTLFASFWGVKGLHYTSDPHNNIIAALLQTLVVLPTLVACGYWAWGFRTGNINVSSDPD
jgi:hypothetical protein